MMTVAASRTLSGPMVCFVGIGLPSVAANLARRTHAPDLVLVYESGTIGAKPSTPPLSIGDDELADTADSIVSVPEIFAYWLQPGRMDVGFLGAAQIDRHGNINTTVVGGYGHPDVRLPGAGGAPEIAASARRVIVVVRQSERTFVERVDFVTSPSRPDSSPFGAAGIDLVITDLGAFRPNSTTGELVMTDLHPGITQDDARRCTGWDLQIVEEPSTTRLPTEHELLSLRAMTSARGDG
jgi:glutaconate CoA-transferase subunit B